MIEVRFTEYNDFDDGPENYSYSRRALAPRHVQATYKTCIHRQLVRYNSC